MGGGIPSLRRHRPGPAVTLTWLQLLLAAGAFMLLGGAITVAWLRSRIDVVPTGDGQADAQVGAERELAAAFPKPNLSRLNEMDGYLGELARTTGDDGPLIFWREIRRSINAPIREHIERVMRGMQP
jgi:hypothetical protein